MVNEKIIKIDGSSYETLMKIKGNLQVTSFKTVITMILDAIYDSSDDLKIFNNLLEKLPERNMQKTAGNLEVTSQISNNLYIKKVNDNTAIPPADEVSIVSTHESTTIKYLAGRLIDISRQLNVPLMDILFARYKALEKLREYGKM